MEWVIGVVVALVWCFLMFAYITENKFKNERYSIRDWLKYHGFGVHIHRNDFLLDSCQMVRLGGISQCNKCLSWVVYWKLYNIRRKKLSREDTIKKLNKLVNGMVVVRVERESKKDFWKD
ncbi:hypothetical protein ASswx1_87 [Aeromonas phage Asswx_1]|uniref:Uncharacterized protein n=1 Tax=Aeromonas phage Asswx_1 TaxID=2419739 RepID=A0A411B7Z9_9CAUD|nr:hypothetical protein ASswx1_87 [Aeromonas phage Asswx_1]